MLNKLRNKIKLAVEKKAVNIIVHKVQKQYGMKSWRTFTVGLAGAIFTGVYPLLQTGKFDIHKDWGNLVAAAGIAFFSYVAKDAAVTGLPTDKAGFPTFENPPKTPSSLD